SEEKITANIQGSEDSQFVEFCLSEEPKSFNMYISKELANIDFTIFNILLENKDNQMFIKREMINLYLKPNSKVNYDNKNNTYNFRLDQNQNNSPFIYTRESLEKRLNQRLRV
ncbi:MAG: hypothetical protein HRU49_05700, partial [Winogradskyella sp.]|uniref:hypothetical protein n=1 Tax=Winogradskyella sp. TaxID=1883156 RepID=UPI0025EEA19E